MATLRKLSPLPCLSGREAGLEALAERVEAAAGPDWDLDLEVYGAFGFPVRRKLAPSRGRGSPGGGIYQHGLQWKAVGHLGSDLGLVVEVVARVWPQRPWSLHSVVEGESMRYRAEIGGRHGSAAAAGGALCAAALRALARDAAASGGPRAPALRQAG